VNGRWLGAALAGATMLGAGAPPTAPASAWTTPVPVLIVGGSAAVGWVDDTGMGYVERGFLGYGPSAGMAFTFTNHAIPGARVMNPTVGAHLDEWVSAVGPGALVAIAWGLLNDVRRHTPPSVVKADVARQIRTALARAAVVVLVTPPATRASFEREGAAERRLVKAELAAARSFRSHRVYVADVFDAEMRYLTRHHLPYRVYMAGPWDPNTEGHRLAGAILARRLTKVLRPGRVRRQILRLMGERAVPEPATGERTAMPSPY